MQKGDLRQKLIKIAEFTARKGRGPGLRSINRIIPISQFPSLVERFAFVREHIVDGKSLPEPVNLFLLPSN